MLTYEQEDKLARLEANWQAEWKARGIEPPAKKPLEETYVRDEVKPGSELDIEQRRKGIEKMKIAGEVSAKTSHFRTDD